MTLWWHCCSLQQCIRLHRSILYRCEYVCVCVYLSLFEKDSSGVVMATHSPIWQKIAWHSRYTAITYKLLILNSNPFCATVSSVIYRCMCVCAQNLQKKKRIMKSMHPTFFATQIIYKYMYAQQKPPKKCFWILHAINNPLFSPMSERVALGWDCFFFYIFLRQAFKSLEKLQFFPCGCNCQLFGKFIISTIFLVQNVHAHSFGGGESSFFSK
jgi:hypothetical protein